MPTIKPTVGRRIQFWLNGCTDIGGFKPHCLKNDQPFDAGIAYVWNDRLLNLDVADHYGQHFSATSVLLLQEGEAPPTSGAYATWMPYQQQKANEEVNATEAMAPRPDVGCAPAGERIIVGFAMSPQPVPVAADSKVNVQEDFYVVWAPDGRSPKFRHEYEYQAVAEAERLAKENPGREFIVLHAVAARKFEIPMERTVFEPRIPF